MLPSAQPARRAISRVVAPLMPRSWMTCSAASRMCCRIPMASSVATGRSVELLAMGGDVAPHEQGRDDGRKDQEPYGHQHPDVHGVHEAAVDRVHDGLGLALGGARRTAVQDAR